MAVSPPGETILIAEDDPYMRRFIRRSLDSQGFQLLEARNGHEALRLAVDQGDRSTC